MKLAWILSLCLVAAACSREASAPKTVHYRPAGGQFSADLPSSWRVDESNDGTRLAAFFPPETAQGSEMIVVRFYPSASLWRSPLDFAQAQAASGRADPIAKTTVAGTAALDVTVEKTILDRRLGSRLERVRSVLVPASGGFFAVQDYSAAGRPGSGDFQALLGSFQLGPGNPNLVR